MKFTIAVAQIDPVLGDLSANVSKHVALADEAIEKGAHLIVFPELSLTGYSIKDMNWDLAVNITQNPGRLQPLIDKSRSISILAGGVEEDESFRIFNTAFFFEDGKAGVAHRKTYPPTYGMFEEMRYFTKGDTIQPVQSKLGTLGVLVCEDLWHISLPYILAEAGAQIIIALVASPTRLGGNEQELQTAVVNTENHKAYSRLLSSYIVFCNRVGFEDGVNFWGGSSIVAPDGDVIASAKLFDEDMLIAQIDEHEVRRARRFSRHFLDEDPSLVLKELTRITRSPK
ncbi:MAG: hydrolase protein [Bacteroidetes bacterium]|jgi:predicted amidohydrolase|nr:hydrolase protein [Bacteroidota bacterium]